MWESMVRKLAFKVWEGSAQPDCLRSENPWLQGFVASPESLVLRIKVRGSRAHAIWPQNSILSHGHYTSRILCNTFE